MEASFTSQDVKTFADQCKDQHNKNYDAYRKALLQGKLVTVTNKPKKSIFRLF